MLSKFRKWIVDHTKTSLIYATISIFCLDTIFVVINYYSNKSTLNANLLQNAKEQQREFKLTLQMTYRNMMQLALYISQNNELNQLFLKGKKAVLKEGGGKGGTEANQARQQLLKKLKPSWDKLTSAFDIRQLHYHIGPGSLSFLRVHKPQKYGDRMDQLRFIIVDTNSEKKPRYGFETGRIYSGLRGVYPIWAEDPVTKKKEYVGALETGTSFKQILPAFAKYFNTNAAVLLTRNHIESKMWPEFIKTYFAKNPSIEYYIESTTSDNVKTILSNITINPNFTTKNIQIYQQGNTYWSVYYFPLRDYRATLNPNEAPSGYILLWTDATSLINTYIHGIWVNIIYAIIAFIIFESILVWLFTRERRIALTERDATIDGLTNTHNRRYFDKLFPQEFSNSKRANMPLSLLFCDIDFFKKYNDTYGHQAGDDCLKQVAAAAMEKIKRESDCLARYGGEEFVIILPNTQLDSAIKIAESVRSNVANLKLPHEQSNASQYVTLSLGVACSSDFETPQEMLKAADQNLYKAKSQGRNCVIG